MIPFASSCFEFCFSFLPFLSPKLSPPPPLPCCGGAGHDCPCSFFSGAPVGPLSAVSTSKMPYETSEPPDRDSELFVELDPTGRYGRYRELLGCGSVKKVYRAFDQEEGIEVAWYQVKFKHLDKERKHILINRLRTEVTLLRALKHKNIISLYYAWEDKNKEILNFITEVCTSGNMREYRNKHKQVSTKALKKWSKQILRGLEYMHNYKPCIIHRDLNSSNLLVNGNIGQVKIGDLGLVAIVGESHLAHSCIGTPEFMAPEMYKVDANYTEKVDIYSFGMCLLEMVTNKIPYSECDNVAQILKKVSDGLWPDSLNEVKDPKFKALIEKCLAEHLSRPSATELLDDPLFKGIDDDDNGDSSL